MGRLARELTIDPATLSNWFHRSDTSARIATAVYQRAEELTLLDEKLATNLQKFDALVKQIADLKNK